jgi:hypothetical protein
MSTTARYDRWTKRAQAWRDENRSGGAGNELPFEVFPSGSVNLGLRLVYRQEWRPLGTQPGEVVRTIPLGPGQIERITTKIVRRSKRTSTLDSTTAIETATETTDTTKDSSEIVNEAMQSHDFNVSAEASASFGFGSAKMSTSYGYKKDERSKETSASLSETMRKTAEKVRRETKVSVVTESEATTQTEQFSEIRNPNNESGITYEYLKLQHQYEVFTNLAELQMVVFVAEDLPSTDDLYDDAPDGFMMKLIRKYDWIFAKVLRDESFRETLNQVTNDPPQTEDLGATTKLETMLDNATERFPNFTPGSNAQGNVSIPDIYAEPQRIVQEEARAKEERRRANLVRQHRFERLAEHIRQNLLYYFQAIWAHEPPDQRFLRYRKDGRRVPIEWRAPLFDSLPPYNSPTPARVQLDVTPTGLQAEVWEIIDPTGPLGYIGNYAVYALQPLAEHRQPVYGPVDDQPGVALPAHQEDILLGIREVLGDLAKDYLTPTGTLRDPARELFRREAEQVDSVELRHLSDDEVFDLVSFLPRLGSVLLDDGVVRRSEDGLEYPISHEQWAEYLYKKNSTRRFLVDTNNLYLNIFTSSGAALEPFQRAHRYLDVLRTAEQLQGDRLKNLRRVNLVNSESAFDPDIDKVVVVADHTGATSTAAVADALRATQPSTNGEAEPVAENPAPTA